MLPNYLANIKSSGIYRFVFDKSEMPGQEAETLRLVVGYSEKGPFNTPVYVTTEDDFKKIFGGTSKKMERYGMWFHRMAIQALKAGPILAFNVKNFEPSTKFKVDPTANKVDFTTFNPNSTIFNVDEMQEIKENLQMAIKDLYNTDRFWTLEPEHIEEYVNDNVTNPGYITITTTDSKETSVTVFMRGYDPKGYDVPFSEWYSAVLNGEELPSYLEGHERDLVSQYWAELFIFNGQFTPDIAASDKLAKFFDVHGNDVKLKPYVVNAFGEKIDTLDALAANDASNFVKKYAGILLPDFRNANNVVISLDAQVNADNYVHKLLMRFNQDMLYSIITDPEDPDYEGSFQLSDLDTTGWPMGPMIGSKNTIDEDHPTGIPAPMMSITDVEPIVFEAEFDPEYVDPMDIKRENVGNWIYNEGEHAGETPDYYKYLGLEPATSAASPFAMVFSDEDNRFGKTGIREGDCVFIGKLAHVVKITSEVVQTGHWEVSDDNNIYTEEPEITHKPAQDAHDAYYTVNGKGNYDEEPVKALVPEVKAHYTINGEGKYNEEPQPVEVAAHDAYYTVNGEGKYNEEPQPVEVAAHDAYYTVNGEGKYNEEPQSVEVPAHGAYWTVDGDGEYTEEPQPVEVPAHDAYYTVNGEGKYNEEPQPVEVAAHDAYYTVNGEGKYDEEPQPVEVPADILHWMVDGIRHDNEPVVVEVPAEEAQPAVYSFNSFGLSQEPYGHGKVKVISQDDNTTTVQVIENTVAEWTGRTFTVKATELTEGAVYQLYDENDDPIPVYVTVEAPQPTMYAFESFNDEQKTTKYGEGIVEVISQDANTTTVRVIENTVAEWTGRTFTVKATELTEGAVYQLYDENDDPIPVYVTVATVYSFVSYGNVPYCTGTVEVISQDTDENVTTVKVITNVPEDPNNPFINKVLTVNATELTDGAVYQLHENGAEIPVYVTVELVSEAVAADTLHWMIDGVRYDEYPTIVEVPADTLHWMIDGIRYDSEPVIVEVPADTLHWMIGNVRYDNEPVIVEVPADTLHWMIDGIRYDNEPVIVEVSADTLHWMIGNVRYDNEPVIVEVPADTLHWMIDDVRYDEYPTIVEVAADTLHWMIDDVRYDDEPRIDHVDAHDAYWTVNGEGEYEDEPVIEFVRAQEAHDEYWIVNGNEDHKYEEEPEVTYIDEGSHTEYTMQVDIPVTGENAKGIDLRCIYKCVGSVSSTSRNVKPLYLKGYVYGVPKPESTKQMAKRNWQDYMFEAFSNYRGLRIALTSRVDLEYRYLVDTFESFVGGECKAILATLCKEKDNAFAILNFPAIKNFSKCDYISFRNEKNEFDTKYIPMGGNPLKPMSGMFSLPSQENGASWCGFFTALKIRDVNTGVKEDVPSAALVSNNFMKKFTTYFPYTIIAGTNRGVLRETGLIGPDFNFGRGDLDNLEPFGVNCMVYVDRKGTCINSNQTAKQNPVTTLSKINVRELVIFLQDEIERLLLDYHWDFNTPNLQQRIKDRADVILETAKNNGGVYVYRNQCDQYNNTDDVVNNEMLVLSTSIEPGMGAGKMVQELYIYRKGGMSSTLVSDTGA